ncbi:MAG: hypothetical protein IJ506_06730 [Clostridia bacterium]|nr:hypothetical protein [Clostridia bacterium]
MRKIKSILGVALMSVVLCFCLLFGGCEKEIAGTYKFKSMTYNQNGMNINLEVGEEFMNMITLTEDYVTVTLNDDGTATMSMAAGEIENMQGTWEKGDDGEIELTFEGETQICKCDGETLTMEEDGAKIVLEK